MKRWPIASNHYPRQEPVTVEAAYIATKYDTIEGYIRMNSEGVYPIIPKRMAWLPENVKYIPINLVTYLRVYDYDFDSRFSEFRRIGNGHLYRLVAEKGEAKIYDNFLEMGTWKNKTLLVGPKDTIQLFGEFAYSLHFGNKRPLLLKFINGRYHAKMRKRDFKTTEEMFNYILDKENVLMLTLPTGGKSASQ